jgi:hypothetical protein
MRSGTPTPLAVFPVLIQVKPLMGVFDDANPQPARRQPRNHLLDQRRLAAA